MKETTEIHYYISHKKSRQNFVRLEIKNRLSYYFKKAGVAQWLEHRPHKANVTGSIPVAGTFIATADMNKQTVAEY